LYFVLAVEIVWALDHEEICDDTNDYKWYQTEIEKKYSPVVAEVIQNTQKDKC
jgi:hypothetical protein